MVNETRREKLILNNQFKLITEAEEFRMSIWIVSFGLENATTGEILIPVIPIFNLDKIVEMENKLLVNFRIYPEGLISYQGEINPFEKTFLYNESVYELRDFFKTFRGKESDVVNFKINDCS